MAYSGRTPHIHVAVAGAGIARFVTQMYVAGEPLNQRDPVFSQIRDPRAQAAVTVALEPADVREPHVLAARFNIVLG